MNTRKKNARKMNARKSLVSVLMLASVLFSACAPAATSIPTATPAPASTKANNEFTLAGDPIPEEFLNVDYHLVRGNPPHVLRFRAPDDPICIALNIEGNCFTFLRTDNPSDPGARGSAALIDGLLAVNFQLCLHCSQDEIGSIEYFEPKEDGGVLFVVKCETKTGADCNTDVGTTWEPQTPWSNFKLPISVSFGSDWHVVDNLPHLFTISNGQVDIGFNIVTTARLADPVDGRYIPFPDDFVSWIKSNPDFTTGEPTQVTVGGISGVQIDAMPIWESTTTDKKTFLNVIDTRWNIVVNDGEWRFILLDNVNGERMLIMFLAAPGKTLNSVVQPQEAQSILDSVVFTK